MNQAALYLASASPRRRDLLTLLGVSYQGIAVSCDESVRPRERPLAYVRRLALSKARAGAAAVEAAAVPVLGADTAVVLGRQILGKPRDRDDGLAMLAALSGREHRVLTAVAVVQGDRAEVVVSESRVRFAETTAAERAAYWSTGEPADKAGAYAVQGLGAVFITRIRGSHSGIMGLPLRETAKLLQSFSVPVFPWTLADDVRGRMPTIR
ncbi:MAG TPA: Maf family protein [Candidatus Acidoferrales bacterium]|nr:Maf family protein [Candidatus Acidoferrales bacterium]